jgi:hypothetical protein
VQLVLGDDGVVVEVPDYDPRLTVHKSKIIPSGLNPYLEAYVINLPAGYVLSRSGNVDGRYGVGVTGEENLRLRGPVLDGHFISQWIHRVLLVWMHDKTFNCGPWKVIVELIAALRKCNVTIESDNSFHLQTFHISLQEVGLCVGHFATQSQN